jgi:hypothetical protein
LPAEAGYTSLDRNQLFHRALRRGFEDFHPRGHTAQVTIASTPSVGAISMRKFTAPGPRLCGPKKHVTRRMAGDNLESPLSSLATIKKQTPSKALCGNVIIAEAATENSDKRSERNRK